MTKFQEVVEEIENLRAAYPAPSSVCDNPHYSPNQVLAITNEVREEAIWSGPEAVDR